MSKPRLKKALAPLTKEQLEELIVELYDIRKEAREYLDYWADPDPKKALEKAEKEVRRIFFVSGVNPRRRPSLTELNQIVKHFMTLSIDHELTSEFLFHVAETECEWLGLRWRRMTYRTSMMKNLENLRIYLDNAYPDEDKSPFALRFERLNEGVRALFHYSY